MEKKTSGDNFRGCNFPVGIFKKEKGDQRTFGCLKPLLTLVTGLNKSPVPTKQAFEIIKFLIRSVKLCLLYI